MIELATEGGMKASDLRLGGGTALATLWQHRLSTDLDFVAHRDVLRQVYGSECEYECAIYCVGALGNCCACLGANAQQQRS